MLFLFIVTLLAIVPGRFSTYNVGHEAPIYGPLVYLMDWKYSDVQKECEFLKTHGFGAVVVSPPTEHVVSPKSPWSDRYEVVSYNLHSQSGSVVDFKKMVSSCLRNNVKIIVDVVLNNMAKTTREKITGSAGSKANPKTYEYPNFKMSDGDFNDPCQGTDSNDIKQVRECEWDGLADLKGKQPHVRREQVKLLNRMLGAGVVGFLVDRARLMWPWELAIRQAKLRDVFYPEGKRPYMLFNVDNYGKEAGTWDEYKDLGRVTDYTYGVEIRKWFTGETNFLEIIKRDKLLPEGVPSENAVVFLTSVSSHMDAERTDVLRYTENPELYKLAVAFMLAYNHGLPLVLSTYKMSKPYNEAGPPTEQGDIVSPGNDCKGGWNCEHRLPEVYKMAMFNLDCLGQDVRQQVQGSSPGQFAFARGTRGFVAFNLGHTKWSQTFTTNLPAGEYCEVITGGVYGVGDKYCKKDATKVKVDATGSFLLEIPGMSVRAIHLWSKTGYRINPKDDEPRIPFIELKGFFSNILNTLFTSGTAEIIPTAAPAGGSPPAKAASAGSNGGPPIPGSVHVRTGTPLH